MSSDAAQLVVLLMGQDRLCGFPAVERLKAAVKRCGKVARICNREYRSVLLVSTAGLSDNCDRHLAAACGFGVRVTLIGKAFRAETTGKIESESSGT
ncbi:hypothetical protein [Schlesneria sp. DSM 10557]|uniref:hypothetical protein n=1 Tax=Schlesneria sp. DSM 10557 TaxID=3044399 RepID=UPI0035A15D31